MGLKQPEFAALVGVSPITVSRWENGQNDPTDLAWTRIEDLAGRSAVPAGTPGADSSTVPKWTLVPTRSPSLLLPSPLVSLAVTGEPDFRNRNFTNRSAPASKGRGLRPNLKIVAYPFLAR